MTDPLNQSGKTPMVSPTWDDRVREAQARTSREAVILMWLGFIVYGGVGISIFIVFGDRPLAGYLVMFFFQLCVLWFGTRKMYQKFATSTELMIEAGRHSEASNKSLSAAADDMRRIRERVERDTNPIGVKRREPDEKIGVGGAGRGTA